MAAAHLFKRQQKLLIGRLEGVRDGGHAPWGAEQSPHTGPCLPGHSLYTIKF